MPKPDPAIDRISAHAYRVPTDSPESDGTLAWKETTIVVVEVAAGGRTGLGYAYGHSAVASLVLEKLAEIVRGDDPFAIPKLWVEMVAGVRNIGWRGISANAISAVDAALWDLKAKLLGVPLARLFGTMRDSVEIYGSGGFTSYSDKQLSEQLAGWVERDGCRAVKMKVGREPSR
ncbi:MAG TPA: mandelate racemase, partial [Alphaproteobacteria bacterium]|nr:mandelate racemase [Alphaproteobacteria bacterium]